MKYCTKWNDHLHRQPYDDTTESLSDHTGFRILGEKPSGHPKAKRTQQISGDVDDYDGRRDEASSSKSFADNKSFR